MNLSAEIEKIKGVNKQIVNKLKRLEIKMVKDLLWHFPFRYEDFRKISKISDLEIGQNVTIRGIVRKISIRRSWRRKIIVVEALIIDETGGISAIWFNQPYIYKILTVGREANFAGKVVSSSNKIYLSNPIYEILKGTTETKHTAGLIPIYPETKGLTSKGLRYLIKPILKELEQLNDFIPLEILKKFNLLEVNSALRKIHFPKTLEQAQEAKKRFAFEDLFLLQLNNLKLRLELNQ
jgi:ATP-dependent DNA helicase RecG